MPEARVEIVEACGSSRSLHMCGLYILLSIRHAPLSIVSHVAAKCRYEIPAKHLEAAVRAVQVSQANCRKGCALKVIDNASAALSRDGSIGGTYGDLDLVIIGKKGRRSAGPITLWDLNRHHIGVSTISGKQTRICF